MKRTYKVERNLLGVVKEAKRLIMDAQSLERATAMYWHGAGALDCALVLQVVDDDTHLYLTRELRKTWAVRRQEINQMVVEDVGT